MPPHLARAGNLFADDNSPLQRVCIAGQPAFEPFPANKAAIMGLTGAQVDAALAHYGQQVGGSVAHHHRRRALENFLCRG